MVRVMRFSAARADLGFGKVATCSRMSVGSAAMVIPLLGKGCVEACIGYSVSLRTWAWLIRAKIRLPPTMLPARVGRANALT